VRLPWPLHLLMRVPCCRVCACVCARAFVCCSYHCPDNQLHIARNGTLRLVARILWTFFVREPGCDVSAVGDSATFDVETGDFLLPCLPPSSDDGEDAKAGDGAYACEASPCFLVLVVLWVLIVSWGVFPCHACAV